MGSAAYSKTNPATKNATVVERLTQSGYQLLGKLNMHELAFGMTGINAYTGTPHNSNFPGFITGGSSSGSAVAVASGEVDVAIGTDTGGSIRLPAACCGVIGLKPTFGRVSRNGVHPQDSSLDALGPMATNIEHIEQCMRAIDPTFTPFKSNELLHMAWLDTPLSDDVQDSMNDVLDTFRAAADISLHTDHLPKLAEAHAAGMTLIAHEAYQSFKHLDSSKLGTDVATRLEAASLIGEAELTQAKAVQVEFTASVDSLLEASDALITATLPHLPLQLADALNGAQDLELSRLVRPFNVSGHPAISIPIGNKKGLPIGLQIIGNKGKDELVCAIARRLIELEI